jgi:hypothetical protein
MASLKISAGPSSSTIEHHSMHTSAFSPEIPAKNAASEGIVVHILTLPVIPQKTI